MLIMQRTTVVLPPRLKDLAPARAHCSNAEVGKNPSAPHDDYRHGDLQCDRAEFRTIGKETES